MFARLEEETNKRDDRSGGKTLKETNQTAEDRMLEKSKEMMQEKSQMQKSMEEEIALLEGKWRMRLRR